MSKRRKKREAAWRLPAGAYDGDPEVFDDPASAEAQRAAMDEMLRALRGERARDLPVEVRPLTNRELANAFVDVVHRTHGALPGWRFCLGAWDRIGLVGLVLTSGTTGRFKEDGILEVKRLAVMPLATGELSRVGTRLLGAAYRAAKAMGYRRLVSYSLLDQPGGVYRAAGWRLDGETDGGSHNRAGRPRGVSEDGSLEGPKARWVRDIEPS